MGNLLDTNYYTIQGWMITRLQLKGIDLSVFAIIYGFTQDGETEFTGSIQYLCDFCGGVSRPTVINSLKRLTDTGLIKKASQTINSVTFNRYKIAFDPVKNLYGGSKEILPGVVKNLYVGSKNSLPNNKEIYLKSDNKEYINTIIDLWNKLPETIAKIRGIEPGTTREKKTVCLIKNHGIDKITEAIRTVSESNFLCGTNYNGWTITYDWFINPSNFVKVLEGNYKNKLPKLGARPFERDPDLDAIF